MKRISTLLPCLSFALLALSSSLSATTLEVGTGRAYRSLNGAAAAAQPGDTILFYTGIYSANQYVTNARGTASAWITITTAPGEEVIVRGGSWQFPDPAWLRISGFTFEGQSGNGLSLDDAGTFDTPAHHIIIENCTWRALDTAGNGQQLKLSGVDSFVVRNCTFNDGPAPGCMVDMVGCHAGLFEENRFERGGYCSIQAKGGTRWIRIERNRFLEGGARAINIGGSTGAPYFRPQTANYEAAEIAVYSNLFTGSDAPIAFAGAVNCDVVNNTIYLPRRWALRILQETTTEGFLQCGNNAFRNNIVVVNSNAANPTLNIGPNTRAETFLFSNNLWFNTANGNWSGPNLPASETAAVLNLDPHLLDPAGGDFRIDPTSPAVGTGATVAAPLNDLFNLPFSSPRSIGAVEGSPTTLSAPRASAIGSGPSLSQR